MKLLLSNDDGIEAPGLAALIAATESLGEPVVVAPAGPQSGVSHAVTYEGLVRIEARSEDRVAIHGTPADCARVGLLKVVPDAKWVLSGINHGGNLGADVYYSGTVAVVREAALHGWPGIAFSQYQKRNMDLNWPRAARWVSQVLKEILPRPARPGLFYNVNLPHLGADAPDPDIVFCPLDPHPLPLSYRHELDGHLFYNGNYHTRERQPGADVDVCFGGQIAVTEIRLF
jgi:5'-nucleotidase